ncbi:MAG TPA: membrane protein insertion efficiency factor YidD [Virgibacillus sp.]|nr:membrane protein insertion efficiency factor YidD [Virgibacillus sp.]
MLNKTFAFICITFIKIYQKFISPIKPKNISCRFYPTCSTYGIIAYEKYGMIKGTKKLYRRLKRCRPDNRESCIDYP